MEYVILEEMLFDHKLIYKFYSNQKLSCVCECFICDAWKTDSKIHKEFQSCNNCLHTKEEEYIKYSNILNCQYTKEEEE